jgi:hypothetical protein
MKLDGLSPESEKNLCQVVQMNRISQALLFLFLALSALEWHFISHVENSAHCV